MTLNDISDHIQTTANATADLVSKMDSIKNILNTILLIGSVAVISVGSYAAYRYTEKQLNPVVFKKELLSQSTDGLCYFYKEEPNDYRVEYIKGFDGKIGTMITLMARYRNPPENINKICETIRAGMKPIENTPITPAPTPSPLQSMD